MAIAQERWDIKRFPPSEAQWRTAYSPLANFHKMPLQWISSSEQAKGFRGGHVEELYERWLTGDPAPQLAALFEAPAAVIGCHTPSIRPVGDLDDPRDPVEDLGWGGHEWTPWCSDRARICDVEESAQGLYRLRMGEADILHFIGRGNIADAMAKQLRRGISISYAVGSWTYHEQLELMTDLVGLYLCKTKNLPLIQYGGEKNLQAGTHFPQPKQLLTLFSRLLPEWQKRWVHPLPEVAIA